MRTFNIILVISFLSMSCYSQRGKKIANIFFNKSVSSFEANELDKSADLLAKSLKYYGESAPVKVAVFGSKLHIKKKEYGIAKKYVKRFFELSKKKKSAQYKYMLELHANLEMAINDGVDFVPLKEIVEDVSSVEEVKVNSVVNNDVSAIKESELVVVKDSIVTNSRVDDEKTLKATESNEEEVEVVDDESVYVSVIKDENLEVEETDKVDSVIEVEESIVSIDLTSKKDSLQVDNDEFGIMGAKERLIKKMRERNNTKKSEFVIEEEFAVYPGCSDLDNKNSKKCFNTNLRNFINTNFKVDFPELAKLITGKVSVFTQLRINEEGVVDLINVKAPHSVLKEEAIRVFKLLPRMKPATQRGKPVSVKLSVPLSFNIK